MKVNKLDNVQFNGYVDKSVYKYLNAQKDILYKDALNSIEIQKSNKTFQIDFFKRASKSIDETLELLNNLAYRLHPATSINIKTSGSLVEDVVLNLSNKKTKTQMPINEVKLQDSKGCFKILENINAILNWASKESVKSQCHIDFNLFKLMIEKMECQAQDTSLLGYIKTKINSFIADDMAQEFGAEPGFGEQFEEIRQQAVEDEKVVKSYQEQFKKDSKNKK